MGRRTGAFLFCLLWVGLFWPLTRERLAWAVRLSDTALRETLDAQIAEWKADGTLRALLRRWIPLRVEVE